MRISDWSSDVCSSDLCDLTRRAGLAGAQRRKGLAADLEASFQQPGAGTDRGGTGVPGLARRIAGRRPGAALVKYLLDSDVIASALKGQLAVVLKLQAMKPGEVAVSVFSQIEAATALRLAPRAQERYGKLLKEFIAAVPRLDFCASEAQRSEEHTSEIQ